MDVLGEMCSKRRVVDGLVECLGIAIGAAVDAKGIEEPPHRDLADTVVGSAAATWSRNWYQT